MKKIKLPIGHIAYETTAAETTNLGGLGICDDCGKHACHGYLVPVLNHYHYESRIPLTGDDSDG